MGSKNKLGMVVIIVLLVVMLIGVGTGLFLVINKLNSLQEGNTGAAVPVSTYSPQDIKTIALTESIKANLRTGEDGKDHLVLVGLSIGINGSDKKASELEELITNNEIIVQDVTISVLRNKTYEDLKKPNSHEVVADEILSRLQEEFQSNSIVKVYLGEYFYN